MSDKPGSVFPYQKNGPDWQGESKLGIRRTEYVSIACDMCRKNHLKCSGEPKCARCMFLNVLCVYNKSPQKRGPKPKSHLVNTALESNDPVHHKVRIQRTMAMESLIQAFDGPRKDLMIDLTNLFNMLVGAGLYHLESPPSIQNEGTALSLYISNAFYNMPTGIGEIDSFCSRNIQSSIKEIVDKFINKLKEIVINISVA
ncbi:10454_t:CDS:1 [Cetraspora pellucida]|uniref:10454_t:CDS:1 n=1 Tax=Cetraspora pellucida TaxID=1433469 RepID=A0ACA9NB82_9GLOM|nr:10454_t:CDS:1 [Cetraspora pellucida]